MCIEITMIRITTDEPTEEYIDGSFRIFTFGLSSQCKELYKEKYERYARLEAHLQLMHKIKEETAIKIREVLNDNPRINIYQPFVLWFALEDYNKITFREISIEIKDKKRHENRTEYKDIDITELDEEKQKIFTKAKENTKQMVIEYLNDLQRAVEKTLQKEIEKEKEKEIEDRLQKLISKYEKVQDILIERLEEYERKQKRYEQEIEHLKNMIEREIAFQAELAERSIINRIKAQLIDMKETLAREKNRLILAYQSAKERVKSIFKRKNKSKDNKEQSKDNDRGNYNDLSL